MSEVDKVQSDFAGNQVQGYWIQDELDILGPVLNRWVRVVTEMVDASFLKKHDEVPWVSRELKRNDKERLGVSLLAGAIWKEGGMCLEEFPDSKVRSDGRAPYGRVDLWATVGDAEFTVEAKSAWSDLTKGRTALSAALQRAMTNACNDVNRCPLYEENRYLGVVFAIPRVPKDGATKTATTKKLREWVQSFDKVEVHAYAYVFPDSSRLFVNGDFVYPGIALLIREVRRNEQPTVNSST